MKIYKVWEFHVPNEVFDFENKTSLNGLDVKVKDSYVVFSASDAKEISFNSSKSRVNIQMDSIRYSSAVKDAGKYKLVTFTQIGGDTSYVLHKGNFNKDEIIGAMFGLKISDSDDNTIQFQFKKDGDSVTFDFSSPKTVTITISKDGNLTINGNKVSDDLNYKEDTFSVKTLSSNKNTYNTSSTNPPSTPLKDSDATNYYLEYDPDNLTFMKQEIELGDVILDKYSSGLTTIKNLGIAANMLSIYNPDTEEYLDRGSYALANYVNSKVCSTQISRIISSLIKVEDNIAIHNYGFFETSDRLFPSYAYVGSSFAYIKYSRAKASTNPCTLSDQDGIEVALYLRVKKDKGIEIKQDKTAKTNLLKSDKDFANKLLRNLKKGFGVFNDDLFSLKRYSDDGSHIKVQYNYQNSKNYYQADIYDETMRYKAIETQKVNGNVDTKTYYYRLYKHNPELQLKNTKANINMYKKVQIDFESDVDTANNYVDSVTLSPSTVLERSDAIIVNPNTFSIKLKRAKEPISLFGVTVLPVDSKQVRYNMLYQPTSDTIYVYDTDQKKELSIEDFVKHFNSVCDHYKLESSCSYSILKYKTLDNKELETQFPISTLFLTELVNGPKGFYQRIYYKNAEDIGHVEALVHKVIDV